MATVLRRARPSSSSSTVRTYNSSLANEKALLVQSSTLSLSMFPNAKGLNYALVAWVNLRSQAQGWHWIYGLFIGRSVLGRRREGPVECKKRWRLKIFYSVPNDGGVGCENATFFTGCVWKEMTAAQKWWNLSTDSKRKCITCKMFLEM